MAIGAINFGKQAFGTTGRRFDDAYMLEGAIGAQSGLLPALYGEKDKKAQQSALLDLGERELKASIDNVNRQLETYKTLSEAELASNEKMAGEKMALEKDLYDRQMELERRKLESDKKSAGISNVIGGISAIGSGFQAYSVLKDAGLFGAKTVVDSVGTGTTAGTAGTMFTAGDFAGVGAPIVSEFTGAGVGAAGVGAAAGGVGVNAGITAAELAAMNAGAVAGESAAIGSGAAAAATVGGTIAGASAAFLLPAVMFAVNNYFGRRASEANWQASLVKWAGLTEPQRQYAREYDSWLSAVNMYGQGGIDIEGAKSHASQTLRTMGSDTDFQYITSDSADNPFKPYMDDPARQPLNMSSQGQPV